MINNLLPFKNGNHASLISEHAKYSYFKPFLAAVNSYIDHWFCFLSVLALDFTKSIGGEGARVGKLQTVRDFFLFSFFNNPSHIPASLLILQLHKQSSRTSAQKYSGLGSCLWRCCTLCRFGHRTRGPMAVFPSATLRTELSQSHKKSGTLCLFLFLSFLSQMRQSQLTSSLWLPSSIFYPKRFQIPGTMT